MDSDGYIDLKDLPSEARRAERHRKIVVIRQKVVNAAQATGRVVNQTTTGFKTMGGWVKSAGKSKFVGYLSRVAANSNKPRRGGGRFRL